jgi:hypothetical protein
MIVTLIVVAVVVIVVLLAMLFGIARAGGPLALETGRLLELVRRRMKDPVAATLQVTGISEPSVDSMDSSGRITGVVSGGGIEPRAVQRSGMMATAKWPKVGQRLPIVIDRANPKYFVIDLTAVKTDGDAALDEAERLAAAMKAGTEISRRWRVRSRRRHPGASPRAARSRGRDGRCG